MDTMVMMLFFFFFQAEDGIRDLVRSRGLGDVYKRQELVVRRRQAEFLGAPGQRHHHLQGLALPAERDVRRGAVELVGRLAEVVLGYDPRPRPGREGEGVLQRLGREFHRDVGGAVAQADDENALSGEVVRRVDVDVVVRVPLDAAELALSLLHISEPTRPY